MPTRSNWPSILLSGRHGPLALEYPDRHGVLVVVGGREHLALLSGNGGVAFDQRGEHTAQGLDTERQRRDVQQQHVLHIALQHAGLDGRAELFRCVG